MDIPSATDTLADEEAREEIFSRADALSVSLDEKKIKKVIGKRIEQGETFWNKKLKLKQVRRENEKRYLNKNLEVAGEDLYDFETDYRDNRIFVSVETLASNVVAKIPVPEVIEAQDTDASRELASNFGKVLYRKAEDLFLKGKFQMVARHLLIGYRGGFIKVGWDSNAGRLKSDFSHTGDVFVNYVRPHKIIIDEGAEDPDDIPLIAEYRTNTVEELGFLFPDKKDDLIEKIGAAKGGETHIGMGTKITYPEVWFSFFDDEGNKLEGLCWKYEDIILDYGLNPNFNYNGDPTKTNFLDRPRKPYIFFNFLRIGRWAFDDTSLTEQAASQQDILEKRGRQIVFNADQAHSSVVFNTKLVRASDAQKYANDPRQVILSKGDVREAFARTAPAQLPKYVLEDKFDARREIDNIMGTHAPLRGEKTEAPTLGQEVLSQRSDIGRQITLSEAMEKGALGVFGQITQLLKVFAEEEHMVKYVGKEPGRTTFIRFSRDKIEDGIEIRVGAGSMKADDKLADRAEAVELAKVGWLDGLTFFEKWHVPNPRAMAKRWFYSKFMPDRYAQEVLEIGMAGGERDAMQTIQRINSGESVRPKENPTKEYIAYYKQFLGSPDFKKLDPEVRALHATHIKGTIEGAKGELGEKSKEKPKETEKGGIFSKLFRR